MLEEETFSAENLNNFLAEQTLNAGTTINRLGVLETIGKVINQNVVLEDLLNSVIEIICRELHANNGSVLLMNEAETELYVAACQGQSKKILEQKVKLGQSIAGRVAKTGNPIIIIGKSDLTLDRSFNKPPRSSVCAAIESKGKRLGVICANITKGSRNFSYKDLQMLQVMTTQIATAIENVRLMEGLKANNYAIVRSLAEAVEAKDPYTRGHCDFVSKYAEAIAIAMNLPPREVEEIKVGAILHDVGKIGISEDILRKNSRLTDEEFEIMKQHPIRSAKIVEPLHLPQNCVHVIKFHHERPDGKGYPYALEDHEIYLGAKIVAVADTFDAITSNRPYRKGKHIQIAIDELNDGRGTQFDERAVDVFLKILPELIEKQVLRPHLCCPEKESTENASDMLVQDPPEAH